jgi:hypothetical protein
MTREQIDEAMRLAGLMATARCVRLTTIRSRPDDKVAHAQVELRVARATAALLKHLESCE